jgi:hypothetical protein
VHQCTIILSYCAHQFRQTLPCWQLLHVHVYSTHSLYCCQICCSAPALVHMHLGDCPPSAHQCNPSCCCCCPGFAATAGAAAAAALHCQQLLPRSVLLGACVWPAVRRCCCCCCCPLMPAATSVLLGACVWPAMCSSHEAVQLGCCMLVQHVPAGTEVTKKQHSHQCKSVWTGR